MSIGVSQTPWGQGHFYPSLPSPWSCSSLQWSQVPKDPRVRVLAVLGDAQGALGSQYWGNVAPNPASSASSHSRHLFAIANVAYSKVMDAKHNQCIVIRWDTAVPMHGPP